MRARGSATLHLWKFSQCLASATSLQSMWGHDVGLQVQLWLMCRGLQVPVPPPAWGGWSKLCHSNTGQNEPWIFVSGVIRLSFGFRLHLWRKASTTRLKGSSAWACLCPATFFSLWPWICLVSAVVPCPESTTGKQEHCLVITSCHFKHQSCFFKENTASASLKCLKMLLLLFGVAGLWYQWPALAVLNALTWEQ